MAISASYYSQSDHPFRYGSLYCDRPDIDCSALYFLLPIVLFARMALNALDGMLARECRQQSRLGAILNETGDVISDIALYLPFLFLADSSAPLVLAMLLAMVMTEFCGILAQTINGVRSYAGPFGKSDRALVFGAGGWR